jgi:hypothetical protein
MTTENRRPVASEAADEKTPDQGFSSAILPPTAHEYDDVDLFGQPFELPEQKVPRRDSADYLKHFLALPLPHGWKFWSLAPAISGLAPHIESIWVVDHEGEHRHLFVDRRTGQEHRFDLESRWSS